MIIDCTDAMHGVSTEFQSPMILCIESATTVCSVALTDNGNVVAFREHNEGFSHAEKLTVFISEVLAEVKIAVKDLDAVAVSSGPGSYTGLRIGVSVSKGLCLSVNIPLISISTLEAIAYGVVEQIKSNDNNILLCPMIDARRMEVYCSLYENDLRVLQETSASIITGDFLSDIRKGKLIYYFGDGAEKCRPILDLIPEFKYFPDVFPSSKFMARLALKKFRKRGFENLALFEPFYLKEYQAGKKIVDI